MCCGGTKAGDFNPIKFQINRLIIVILLIFSYSFFLLPVFFFNFASVWDWYPVWFIHADSEVTAMKYNREKNRFRYINLIGGEKKKGKKKCRGLKGQSKTCLHSNEPLPVSAAGVMTGATVFCLILSLSQSQWCHCRRIAVVPHRVAGVVWMPSVAPETYVLCQRTSKTHPTAKRTCLKRQGK